MRHLLPSYRTALIDLMIEETTIPAIKRARKDGKIEVLGGFTQIPPGTTGGYILRVTAKYGTEYLVALRPDPVTHHYRVSLVETIPWEFWAGDMLHDPHDFVLCNGDNPEEYEQWRIEARDE